jgi:hypothetical protein
MFGQFIHLTDLVEALDKGIFTSLEDLSTAIRKNHKWYKYHLTNVLTTIPYCECGRPGATPCATCMGAPHPYIEDESLL